MIRQELELSSPWMNASGALGFTPAAPPGWPLPETLGAFITNPISLTPRTPAAERACLPYSGGFLLHSGLPNPGLSAALRRFSKRWAQSPVPVWVHILADTPAQAADLVRRLENCAGVAGIEIGLPADGGGEMALDLVRAALGELPLAACLPLNLAGEDWVKKLPDLGASAITLSAPRGALLNENGKPVRGRLFGPALLPWMFPALFQLRKLGLPLIAGAGIQRRADAEALLKAGAVAIQIDSPLWRGWL